MDIGQITQWLENNIIVISLANLSFFLIIVVVVLSLHKKLHKYRFLCKGNEDKNLEQLIMGLADQTQVFNKNLAKLETQFANNVVKAERHLQRCSLIRFQAFQNTGGDQSFALAMLDSLGNGVVITSIFGRDESRVYCKPVDNGKSSYALSKEEQAAITKALGDLAK